VRVESAVQEMAQCRGAPRRLLRPVVDRGLRANRRPAWGV